MVEHYNENTLYQGSENYSGIKKQIHEFGLNKRVKIFIRKKQNGLLLDIGCGSGSFIKYVAKHTQFKVMGTEVNKKQVDRLQKTDAFPILLGDIDQLSLPSDHFDVITLWDVIEHVPDPISMLTEINKIIKPDGLVVIRVPNGNSLNSKLFGKYWAGIDAPRHYYVFTNETLSMLLTNTGFSIQSHKKDIGSYLNFLISLRFWLNDKKMKQRYKNIINKVLSSFLIRAICYPFFLIKDFLFQGTSLTVIASPKSNN